ncbi:MAG: ATP-binding protein [Chloroflexi bacterium]|nr:ATP-binding protein [Chloroflexota bacterium]
MKTPFLKFIETELGENFVLVACGLPSTGKTVVTREIARVKGHPVLRSDLIRLEVLKGEDIFDEKVASDMAKRNAVYDEMFRRADETLKKSTGIILDATFASQSSRRQAAEIAAKHKLPFVIVETVCPREVAIERILARSREDYQSNALTEQAYLNVKKAFEKVDLSDLKRLYPELPVTHIVVDTSRDNDWYVTSVKKR